MDWPVRTAWSTWLTCWLCEGHWTSITRIWPRASRGYGKPDSKTQAQEVQVYTGCLLQDRVLNCVENNSTMRVIPPTVVHEKIYKQAHEGRFGAHQDSSKK